MNASRRSSPGKPSTSPPASGERSKGRTRLVIGDADPSVLQWLRGVLTPLGAEVVEVGSGTELELHLASNPADLVITNSQLPSGTGLQALARARASGDTTPFIVYTSLQKELLRVFVSDASGTVLSSRVVDSENLVALAEGMLNQRRSEDAG